MSVKAGKIDDHVNISLESRLFWFSLILVEVTQEQTRSMKRFTGLDVRAYF